MFARQLLQGAAALHRVGGLACGLSPEIIRMTEDEEGERLLISSAGIAAGPGPAEHAQRRHAAWHRPPRHRGAVRRAGGADGPPPDVLADVFTCGVLIYEMATSRLPFNAPTLHQLLGAMLTTRPRTLAELSPDLPEAFAGTRDACLASDPSARPATIADLPRVGVSSARTGDRSVPSTGSRRRRPRSADRGGSTACLVALLAPLPFLPTLWAGLSADDFFFATLFRESTTRVADYVVPALVQMKDVPTTFYRPVAFITLFAETRTWGGSAVADARGEPGAACRVGPRPVVARVIGVHWGQRNRKCRFQI